MIQIVWNTKCGIRKKLKFNGFFYSNINCGEEESSFVFESKLNSRIYMYSIHILYCNLANTL